jgi:hypothetical protein
MIQTKKKLDLQAPQHNLDGYQPQADMSFMPATENWQSGSRQ